MLKKCIVLVLMAFLLSGCGVAETFETVEDDWLQPVMAPMSEIKLALPESAAAPVLSGENGEKLYLCDDYVLTVQTLEAGDMDRTARSISGFPIENLTVMETASGTCKRRDWVWTAAGEGGDQIGRAAVLDDGTYHYCVTVMAGEEQAGSLQEQWDEIFDSFSIDP